MTHTTTEPFLYIPPDTSIEFVDEAGILAVTIEGYRVIEGGLAAAILESVAAGDLTASALAKSLSHVYDAGKVREAVRPCVVVARAVDHHPRVDFEWAAPVMAGN